MAHDGFFLPAELQVLCLERSPYIILFLENQDEKLLEEIQTLLVRNGWGLIKSTVGAFLEGGKQFSQAKKAASFSIIVALFEPNEDDTSDDLWLMKVSEGIYEDVLAAIAEISRQETIDLMAQLRDFRQKKS